MVVTFDKDSVSCNQAAQRYGNCAFFQKGVNGAWENKFWFGHGSTFAYDPEKDVFIETDYSNQAKTTWKRVYE